MYRPPLRDIKFVLEHVVDLDALVKLPAFDHVDVGTVHGLLDEAGRFMSEVVAPTNRVGDTQGAVRNDDGTVTVPEEFAKAYQQYVAAGWNGIKSDEGYGGHGFPGVIGLAVQEMLTTANMAFSLCPMLTMSAILALTRHGTDEQKAAYLEKLISGEWTGTMVLTEPEAGSDLGALRTKATPADDGTWRVSGTKIFITWGEHDMAENIIHLVLARAPDGPPGTKGISLFIVPKFLPDADGRPGEANAVSCVSIEHKLGIHGSPTCVMAFDEAVGYLVGEVNDGMRAMFTMMNDARLHVGLEGLGITERAYQLAAAHAAQRTQGRAVGAPPATATPIIEHPDVRRMLLTMKAYSEAMRGLLYDTARAIDLSHHHPDLSTRRHFHDRASLLTPVVKAWCTDLGVEMASVGIQIHGGMGFVEETGAAQYYRDARIAPIYEGTNGIQGVDLVTRKLPLAGGEVVRSYLDELAGMCAELEAAGTELASVRRGLEQGVDQLRTATEWLLARTDPNDALAAATPYLRLFGTVAGGCCLARQARAAVDGAGDDDFLAAKVATTRFYVDQLLPQAFGLVPAATADASALFAVTTEMLGV
ncbi:MAG: acyl-CoA dehydrogenase C-terminal domain-containing protein [Actinomycetota bacterium]|nr:acyl-CoA dehydrogenase C-terminal domain-containing protein [Actinomycetota bacterium]